MDASQNTDIGSDMSSQIHVSHGTGDKRGERGHLIGQKSLQEVEEDKETHVSLRLDGVFWRLL